MGVQSVFFQGLIYVGGRVDNENVVHIGDGWSWKTLQKNFRRWRWALSSGGVGAGVPLWVRCLGSSGCLSLKNKCTLLCWSASISSCGESPRYRHRGLSRGLPGSLSRLSFRGDCRPIKLVTNLDFYCGYWSSPGGNFVSFDRGLPRVPPPRVLWSLQYRVYTSRVARLPTWMRISLMKLDDFE